jgi:HEAT repeat protein
MHRPNATLPGLVLVLVASLPIVEATGRTDEESEASTRARERVAAFETHMWKSHSGVNDDTRIHESPEVRTAVREFFTALDGPDVRIAAMDLLDRRYVYLVDQATAAELLGPLIRDDDPAVRTRAAKAIAYNDCGARYAKELIAMLDGDPPADRLVSAARAMGRSKHRPFVPHLERLFAHAEAGVRTAASDSLTRLAPEVTFDLNVQLLDDPDTLVRRTAVRNLPRSGDPRAAALVEAALDDPAPEVREDAVLTLRYLASPRSIDAIARTLADPHPYVRSKAAQVLGRLQAKRHAAAVAALLDDSSIVVRRIATIALGEMGERRFVESLKPLLNDPDEQIRDYAAKSIGQLEDAGAR